MRASRVAAPLAAGELTASDRGLIGQADQADRLCHRSRRRVVAAVQGDALLDREFGLGFGLLQHHADAGPPGAAGLAGVDAQDAHLAGAAMPVALEDLDGRRLACAIGAEEGEDFTRHDIQVDPRDRFKAAIGHVQVAHADDGGGGRRRAMAEADKAAQDRIPSPSPRRLTEVPRPAADYPPAKPSQGLDTSR